MEKKLRKLFDYQRFEKDGKLEKLIQETESRYAAELSDDDLTFVNAAGDAAITDAGLPDAQEIGTSGGLGGNS